MFYDFSLPVPANTSYNNRLVEPISLTHGIIHRVEIDFPAGCEGSVHLKIRHGLHQLWPTNPQGSFSTNDYVIAFNDYYPYLRRPYLLTLVAWNLDPKNQHTLAIRFGVLPQEVLMPEASFTAAFKKLMSRLRL